MTATMHSSWRDPAAGIPRIIDFPKGMLGPEERRALFWYARELVDGRGHIIDAGSFIGTSAFSMACGLAHSRHPNAYRSKVHAYDMFEAFEAYTADWVSREFGGHIGTEFQDIFEYQLGRYLDRVVMHKGDVLNQRWTGEPVEILFIDVAKTPELNSHLARQFFPALIPGHSIVIHQDYFFSRHPWIHASMEYLHEHFELLDGHVKWCSRIWRLISPIPTEKLAKVTEAAFSADETEELIQRGKRREDAAGQALFDLLLIQNDLFANRHESAARRLDTAVPAGDTEQVSILEQEKGYLRTWLASVAA